MKLLTWNIHQQGGAGGGRIPPFVKDEISGADIAALTEFGTNTAGEGRQAFISDMTREGFCCTVSENVGGNDILIAVKSGYPILDCSWVPCWGVDSIPENLRVDLDCGGTVLTVAAIRIKSLDGIKSPAEKNRLRRQEFCWALDWLKGIKNPVLLTGDWNNNRRGSENQDWSMSILRELLEGQGFRLYTPEGSSIFEEHSDYGEFPYDHFATKGAKVLDEIYDRDFTGRDPSAYAWGRNFRQSWRPGVNSRELASVAPPFPDHAILKGTLRL